MANEATQVEGPYEVHDFDVYDSQAIPMGSICVFSGSRACKVSFANDDVVAGIAMSEKVALDGTTRIGLATSGIFKCYFDAACALGNQVTISGANILKIYTTCDEEKGYVLGKLLETATAGTYKEVYVST